MDDDDDDMLGYCARVCRKPTLSYDVTLENATAIIASEKEVFNFRICNLVKVMVMMMIIMMMRVMRFEETYVFVPHVLQHPQFSVCSLRMDC